MYLATIYTLKVILYLSDSNLEELLLVPHVACEVTASIASQKGIASPFEMLSVLE